MSNREIRNIMKKDKIYMWQIADKLSIHETTLVKRFRHELTSEGQQEVLSAIEAVRLDRAKAGE